MAIVNKPYEFTDNTAAEASEVNANFDTLYNDYNGGITAANLATDAVTTAKIADGNVTTAKLDDEAVTFGKLAPSVLAAIVAGSGMHNGKIEASVASNNLTLTIKTASDGTPSTSDPVYVNIGGTVRSITSALSVTKNAGTNWMNLGSAEHATQDVDLFAYLGYNATDGVVIGFSRIPYALKYGDFSTTTTNDKYCAISTITNATSTDSYVVIGRFNATLSAAASYNWSIPGTAVVVQRPIYETRWLSYAPAWTSITVGNGTNTGLYKMSNLTASLYNEFNFGSTSAVTGSVSFTSPTPKHSSIDSEAIIGLVTIRDNGGSVALGRLNGGNTIYAEATSGSYATAALLSSTVPITFSTNDMISVTSSYPMA